MARASSRSMEMAVRLSLGASRRQLLTQLLTESLVLAAIGGIVSLFVARWTLAGFIAMLPHDSNTLHDPYLSLPIIVFTAALSVVTGVAFGLYPALHSTRPDLVTSIRANAGQIAGARSANFFRSSLATGQIALSTTLLISAGFFIKSLVNVTRVDLGLRADNLVTFGISPSDNAYSHERSRVFFERLESDLAALPSVTGVTAGAIPILAGDNWGNDVSVEGVTWEPDKDMNSNVSEVAPNYFRVIGATMLQGREFTTADAAGSPKVAIVNEAFAKKFNLLPNVVGKHISRGSNAKLDIEIVGLVRNNKYSDVKLPVPPVLVTPWRQDTTTGYLAFYVRTNGSTDAVLSAIPGVIKKLDPNLPYDNLQSMPRQVAESTFLDRMMSKMAAAFALLATILAAVGLYGVLAYSVAQRTREIGVRMALGADGAAVQGLVLKQVAMMTLIGAVIGVPAAIAIGYLARSQLFEMKGTDPFVIVTATLLLSFVAFLAGYIPALRASRISPMQALRYE
jgi:predicted permease